MSGVETEIIHVAKRALVGRLTRWGIALLAMVWGGWVTWASDTLKAERAAVVKEAVDSTKAALSPRLDSMSAQIDAVSQKVQEVNDKMDAMISVMNEAMPEFKKAAKARARRNMDSREIREALEGRER